MFDGIDDHVDLHIGPLVGALGSSSFAAWVNSSNAGGPWQRIFDFGTGASNYMFLTPRQGTTGAMTFGIMTPTAAETRVVGPSMLGTGWHHVGVVIDGIGRTVWLYLDGDPVAVGSTRVLPMDLGKTTRNWLGRSQYPADGYLAGMLDDFRIYNRALSWGEVHYLAGDR